MDLGPFLVGRTCSHHARNNCQGIRVRNYCAGLVPFGKKWACVCAAKWVLCLVVFGGVSMCQCVLVCVVFLVLLVASVLASVRWLLCGGDGSKKEKRKNDACNFKKMSHERTFPITVLFNSKNKICSTHFCNYFAANGMPLTQGCGSSSVASSSCGALLKEGLLSTSWLFYSCSLRSWGLAPVVASSGSLSGSSSTFAVCMSALPFFELSLRLDEHPQHSSLCCLEFLFHFFSHRPAC